MSKVLIGLGGTGCSVLKLFTERLKANTAKYSQISGNPDIALWSIDADDIEYTSGFDNIWIRTELSVPFAEKVENKEFKSSRYFQEWFDPEWRTSGHINSSESPGAGQIKMNGRFAFYNNINKIDTALNRLLGMRNISNTDRFFIVTSLFGGTGSGMFFDLIYLLQGKGIPATEIRSFILDPSTLEVIDPRKSNYYSWIAAYPSFVELDFWQSNNNKRNNALQYSMHYNDAIIVKSNKYLSKPMFLFGGKDEKGRSLKSSDSSFLFKNYQKYIADIIYEMTFSKPFKQHLGKNTIDNIAEELINDHSTMFASVGISYLKFPKEKISNYLQNYFLQNIIKPIFSNSIISEEVKSKKAVEEFLQKHRLLQNEFNQIISEVKQKNEYINWLNSISSSKDKIERATKGINLSRDPVNISDSNLEKILEKFVNDKINKTFKLTASDDKYLTYLELLTSQFIPELLEEDISLPDIISIVKMISLNIEKEIRKAKEMYGISSELESGNYDDRFRKSYKKLKSSKNTLFNKAFNQNKILTLKIFSNYLRLYESKLNLNVLLGIYETLIIQTNKVIIALEYLRDRMSEAIYIKTPESNHILRKSPFIFDKEKAGINVVHEIYIGDNEGILKSKVVQNLLNSIIQSGKNSKLPVFLKRFLSGSVSIDGFNEIFKVTIEKLNSEGAKGINDEIFRETIKENLTTALDGFVLKQIPNKVESIDFDEVLNWQFREIYNTMKNLKENYKHNAESFNIARGQFTAMFGEDAQKLIDALDNKNTRVNEWIKDAITTFIRNLALNEVDPLWLPKGGDEPEWKDQIKVHIPQKSKLKIKTTATDVFEVDFTDDNDRIAILKFSHTMPLSSLDFITDDLRLLYDNHKKVKLKSGGEKINPVHTDYRFYNMYSWDLFKSLSEMDTSLLTIEFALSFIISKDHSTICERKKNGFYYNPSSKIPQKQIKLGSSYHKSFVKLLGENELSNDLVYQVRDNLKKEIYTIDNNLERANFAKELVAKTIKNLEGFKPPKVKNSEGYELWELTNKNLKEYYQQLNDNNYLQLLNL